MKTTPKLYPRRRRHAAGVLGDCRRQIPGARPPAATADSRRTTRTRRTRWHSARSCSGTTACRATAPCPAFPATCPALGWGDGGQISRGYPGTKHWRNSQTVLNSAYYNKLFWEGSVTSLEGQAPAAAGGGVAGNGDDSVMEMRLRFLPEYVTEFNKVFGSEWPRINDAWRAIAAYQRTLISDAKKVPADRYAMGDKKALNDSPADAAWRSTTARPTASPATTGRWPRTSSSTPPACRIIRIQGRPARPGHPSLGVVPEGRDREGLPQCDRRRTASTTSP